MGLYEIAREGQACYGMPCSRDPLLFQPLGPCFKDIAFNTRGLGFDYGAGQSGHSVANGSPCCDVSSELRVALALSRVACFGVILRL